MLLIAITAALSTFFVGDTSLSVQSTDNYKLVWSDEFNKPGKVDTTVWQFEKGFVRNNELQWYQQQNAWCENGKLIIEARREKLPNPGYKEGSNNYRESRKEINYTSASVNTRKTKAWKYGRFEIRAKIIAQPGLWPAIWTLGQKGEWPSNGEIDIMEYYKGDILANVATGTSERYKAKWFTTKKAYTSFNDPDWDKSFHTWRMDWDEHFIKLYMDDILLNEVSLNELKNPDGSNPFRQPHYLLLNLAIGGDNGGDPTNTAFPNRYEIDYVRVYQK
ncbi:glycoside hydrolase family 16 protein [Niabella ginsengisoli]|uniref:Glycoside hydrolase family 16 protein n=1 Tax=Niabella ginsengisoli TaxID=522298 RepID=A0ABS9SKG8_9BACT|nr:glycoside hydrolase family 16 protein [Niabella ginsengisoli]MCH5598874.1 glycoside hydrolase family 16 protein [Niabella ginsengisoli]